MSAAPIWNTMAIKSRIAVWNPVNVSYNITDSRVIRSDSDSLHTFSATKNIHACSHHSSIISKEWGHALCILLMPCFCTLLVHCYNFIPQGCKEGYLGLSILAIGLDNIVCTLGYTEHILYTWIVLCSTRAGHLSKIWVINTTIQKLPITVTRLQWPCDLGKILCSTICSTGIISSAVSHAHITPLFDV